MGFLSNLFKTKKQPSKGRQAKYVIRRNAIMEYYFILQATNGKTICVSESYKTKQGAEVGIASIQANGATTIIQDDSK